MADGGDAGERLEWQTSRVSLHCAATLVVRHPADALDEIEVLRTRRLAGLYAVDPDSDDVRQLSASLGLPATEVELAPGTRWGFAHLNKVVLQGISDLHRGESVLVLMGERHLAESIDIEIGDDGLALRDP